MVADDHPLYRRALSRALADDARIELVAEVQDGTRALETIKALSPDVALLDLRMPDLSGEDIVAELVECGSPTRVLLISATEEVDVVRRALRRGAGGFIDKRSQEDEILAAVLRVAAGERVISPLLTSALIDDIEAPTLSPREHEVLVLAASGLDGHKIAERLYITHATVRTHFSRIYSKLGVSDRGAAIATAIRAGILR